MERVAPRLVALIGIVMLTSGLATSMAQDETVYPPEHVKAALLYVFFQHIEWPKNAVPGDDKIFVIGVLGPNPLGKFLDEIEKKDPVKGRKVVVRPYLTADDYKPCHCLFIAPGDKKVGAEARLAQARALIKDDPVLLVSDSEGLAQKGAMINFAMEERNIKLEINVDASQRARLKIPAQLLGSKQVRIIRDSVVGK